MKKVRECFHMLITAVICLMVSMVPGKNVTAAIVENNVASEILSTREKHMADRFTQSVMDKMRSLWISSYLKRNRMWKNSFSGFRDRVIEKQKLFPYYIGIRKQFLEVLKLFSVEY